MDEQNVSRCFHVRRRLLSVSASHSPSHARSSLDQLVVGMGNVAAGSVQTLLLLNRCTDRLDFAEDIVYVANLNKTFVEII
jgi:hypothetical protein